MKLKCLFVFLTVCLMVSSVSAQDWSAGFYWDSNTANWTAANTNPVRLTHWVDGTEGPPSGSKASWDLAHLDTGLPNGSVECIIGKNLHYGIVSGGNVTVNSYIEWAPAGYAAVTGNRMRVGGNATLNIVDGAEFIGPGFVRVGAKSLPNSLAGNPRGVSTINQTGGLFGLLAGGHDTTKLRIGDGLNDATVDSDGLYYMTGGTLESYGQGEGGTNPNDDIGQITIGDRLGTGKFQVVGTAPHITMGELYVGAGVVSLLSTAYRASTGTLEFDLKEGGVSPIVLIPKTVQSTGAYMGCRCYSTYRRSRPGCYRYGQSGCYFGRRDCPHG